MKLVTTVLSLALALVVPVSARGDSLGNPFAEPGHPSPGIESQIGRDDFGPCATNIDFDGLVGGDNSCNGDHITNQYPGLVFSVAGACVVCANSFLGGLIPDNSDPNVAYAQQNLCTPQADHADVAFVPPVQRVGTDFWTSVNSNFRIRAYASDGTLLEDITVTGTPAGSGFWGGFLGIDAGAAIIASIHMLSRPLSNPDSPFNFSFDDFIFEGDCPTPVDGSSWGRVKAIYR